MTILASRQHHEQHELHPRHIDCSCTKSFRVVPMTQDRPNKNRVCSVGSCKPESKARLFREIKTKSCTN